MNFEYKGKTYFLYEMVELDKSATSDMVAIMEDSKDGFTFIDFFSGATTNNEEQLIKTAKAYIDLYYDK